MGFNNSWFGGVSSYADAVKKAANLQDLNSISEARENLSVYSKAAVDAKISDVSDIVAGKSNIGTFHFGSVGGCLQTTGNPMYGVVDRSYCMTLELDEDWNLNATENLWLNLAADGIRASSLIYGGVWCQLQRSSDNINYLQIVYGDGTNTYINAFGTKVNVKTIFGGTNSTIPAGKYSLCICIHFGEGTSADPSKAYIYINSALKTTISGYSTTKKTNLGWVEGGKLGFFDSGNYHTTNAFSTYGKFIGKASRFAVFNFDMSASDAPYTVADYVIGKIPSVELCDAKVQWGSFTATGSNPTLTHGADDSFAASITAYSSSTIPSFLIPFKAKKGTKVRFRGTLSWTSSAGDTPPLHFSIRNSSDASASAFPYEATSGTAFDFESEATDDIAYIGLRATGATGGSTITYTGTLHVERDALVLTAADYAIARNSTTKLVKDITGNGNDLTVYGDVVGDKDAAIAAFVDELKTQISQQSTNS